MQHNSKKVESYLFKPVGFAAAGELTDVHMARVAVVAVVHGVVGDANGPLTLVAPQECCNREIASDTQTGCEQQNAPVVAVIITIIISTIIVAIILSLIHI